VAASDRRAPTPEDLYRIVVPTDPRLSPDGTTVTFTVQRVRPTFDGYASAIWTAPLDGAAPARQLTIGARRDSHGRWSPDGRQLAFLSDRRPLVEEEPGVPADREDGVQIHLLPIAAAGEARRLTNLPRGVEAFEWSPDGKSLAVLSSSVGADHAADARARRKSPDARGPVPDSRPDRPTRLA